MIFCVIFVLEPLKYIVMETKEKTGVSAVAQVIFRPSAERRGSYLFHYGRLTPDGTFAEDSELSFSEFLETIGVPVQFAASFMEGFSDSELGICGFGYLSQERFDSFMHIFVHVSDGVQLYPGMLVLTFNNE